MQEKNMCHKEFCDRFKQLCRRGLALWGNLVELKNWLCALSLTFQAANEEQIAQEIQSAQD